MRGRGGLKGEAKGSEAYCIIGFRVPTTYVGARGEGVKRAKHIVY